MIAMNKIFLFLLTLYCKGLLGIDDYDNRRIEKLWDLESLDRRQPVMEKKTSQKSQVPPFFTIFLPEKQEFQITPNSESVITGKFGTTLVIPPNSISLPLNFRNGDVLILEMIEAVNVLDFLSTGVDLSYTDPKGVNSILESGGMVKLSISYYSKPLILKRGARLRLSMPARDSSKQMKVFKMEELRDTWSDRGIDEKAQAQSDGKERITNFMEDLSWWGFKFPNSDTTCIRGSIETSEKNPPYSVAVLGLDFRGGYAKQLTSLDFVVNVPRNKKSKILVMDEKGNVGMTAEIVPDTERVFASGDEKSFSKCMQIGSITLKKVPPETRLNRGKFATYLGLKEE